ncbi:subtype B tannase [Lachnospiraceae bacterium C1.1]|nr:subtype B tannase [Lachnospiraceae bacterium C1.1]
MDFNELILSEDDLEIKKYSVNGRTIFVRAFLDKDYCLKAKDEIEKINIFIPEAYFKGLEINGYNRENAPLFIPNTVGGYMAGPAEEPGIGRFNEANSLFRALEHGYIAVSAGVRGRNSGKESNEFFEGGSEKKSSVNSGILCGRAPAFIVDMKAAIRFLRLNASVIGGNMEHIITNGTSAGGALSALTGASGNSEDYKEYLEEIGAAEERDDIFAASCYCPIHNLEHADMAYEWLFHKEDIYHMYKKRKTENGIERIPFSEKMDAETMKLSEELAAEFPGYLNSLELKDRCGEVLTLDEKGEGSFKEYLKGWVIRSAQKELDTYISDSRKNERKVEDSEVENQDYLHFSNGVVKDLDWDAYIAKISRMKPVFAFDHPDLTSPENEEFGDENTEGRHFTEFAFKHSKANGEMANRQIIKMMNPLSYINDKNASTASHWRIRHGAFDRDTAIAIPVILATALQNAGADVDFFLPWGRPHSGDYDLEELFAWIDGICS